MALQGPLIVVSCGTLGIFPQHPSASQHALWELLIYNEVSSNTESSNLLVQLSIPLQGCCFHPHSNQNVYPAQVTHAAAQDPVI